ncbi:YdcF family protein [Actinokineospora enzanensis]|uniref:YdcF family protein n=1 Tax=Actinokineospora enzanensis TaxID=155975 RepID=UPI000687FAEF|nr:YdcF family protein [Actinokineospora enzanensis]
MRSVPPHPRPLRRFLRRLLVGIVLMGVLVVGGTAFRVWQVARVDDRDHADVVVVLGAAQYAGKPSKVLEARLRQAKALYDQHVADYVVTGGGRRAGDKYTEAEAGRKWLIDRGVPADRVIGVGEGNDTLGTLKAVATEVKDRGWETAVIVSDPWHSLRARTMAKDAGLDAWTSPTHTGPIVQTRETQAKYILRETAALLYYRSTNASADGIAIDEEVG